MKKAIILINGNLSKVPQLKKLLKVNNLIICADGGAEYAYKQNILPNIIIGDLDSLSTELKTYYENKRVEFIQYPTQKDMTDAELAINYAMMRNADEIIICGLLGDRLDHILANMFYLAKIAQKRPLVILEGKNSLYFVSSSITIHGKKGDELSLIPLTHECEGVTTQGLQYTLQHEQLSLGTTRGISNVFLNETCSVTLTKGTLLISHNGR